jgi:glycosyltransferase involved in cell wall biosynthesis
MSAMTPDPIRYSVVILTYARDEVLAEVIDRLASALAGRTDCEVILVDNNPDAGDRARLLERFAHARHLWSGGNRGVVARNDGFDAARGEITVLFDDDVLIETPDFLDRFGQRFAADPLLGAVTIAKHVRGATGRRVDLIPHTDKRIDLTQPFPSCPISSMGWRKSSCPIASSTAAGASSTNPRSAPRNWSTQPDAGPSAMSRPTGWPTSTSSASCGCQVRRCC